MYCYDTMVRFWRFWPVFALLRLFYCVLTAPQVLSHRYISCIINSSIHPLRTQVCFRVIWSVLALLELVLSLVIGCTGCYGRRDGIRRASSCRQWWRLSSVACVRQPQNCTAKQQDSVGLWYPAEWRSSTHDEKYGLDVQWHASFTRK